MSSSSVPPELLSLLGRAADQKQDIQFPFPNTADVNSTAPNSTPSAPPDFDALWSAYESQLAAARESSSLGLTIYPAVGFVCKLLHELPVVKKGTAVEKQKVFLNLCQDENISAPVTEKRLESPEGPAAAADIPISEAPEQLRIPLSIGPIRELPDVDKQSGTPIQVLAIDIVLSPSTVLQCSGDAAFRQIVAQFAAEKVAQKYGLKFVENQEIKFPKLKYKGSLPPPSHYIRKPQKAKIEEIEEKPIKKQNGIKDSGKGKESAIGAGEMKEVQRKRLGDDYSSGVESVPDRSKAKIEDLGSLDTPETESETEKFSVIPADMNKPTMAIMYLDAEGTRFTPTEWNQEKSERQDQSSAAQPADIPIKLELEIELPGAESGREFVLEFSALDFLMYSLPSLRQQGKHRYFLYYSLPFAVEESSIQALFINANATPSLRIVCDIKRKIESNSNPSQSIKPISPSVEGDKQSSAASKKVQPANESAIEPAENTKYWDKELNLQNSLRFQLSL